MEDSRFTSIFIMVVDQVPSNYRRDAHNGRLPVVEHTPPPALPILHGQMAVTRRRDVTRGLVCLSLFCIICMVYHVAWLTATQFSVMIAVLVLTLLVHAMYLCIYGMEGGGVISPQESDEFVRHVEETSFVRNYFAPNPTVWRLPQRLWEGLVGIGRDGLG